MTVPKKRKEEQARALRHLRELRGGGFYDGTSEGGSDEGRKEGWLTRFLLLLLSVLLMPRETQLHCGGATTRFTGERNPHLASLILASKTD